MLKPVYLATAVFLISNYCSIDSSCNPPCREPGELGETTIADWMAIENRHVVINGNLSIVDGGTLSVAGSDLCFNSSANGSLNIRVERGGCLRIIDCTLRSTSGFSYDIFVEREANCSITGSEIRNCGYYCMTRDTGIIVQSLNFSLDKTAVFYEYSGIVSDGGNISITNSTLIPNMSLPDGSKQGFWSILAKRKTRSIVTIDGSQIFGAIKSDDGLVHGADLKLLKADTRITNAVVKECCCYFDDSTSINTSYTSHLYNWTVLVDDRASAFENTSITNTLDIAVQVDNAVATFSNCSLSGKTLDLSAGSAPEHRAVVNLINTSATSYKINNEISLINRSNFLSVRVVGEQAIHGIENVTIKIFDSRNNLVSGAKTEADGRCQDIPIMWKQDTMASSSIFTPHKVVVEYGNARKDIPGIDMSENRDLFVVLDDVPPRLNVIQPMEGLVTNQPLLHVTGTTDSDAILSLNGQGIENQKGAFNASCWLNEGNNTLVVGARDIQGNRIEETRNVSLNTIPPSLEIRAPKDGSSTNASSIDIVGRTNGTIVAVNGDTAVLDSLGDFIYRFKFTSEKSYSFLVTAWDAAGNTRSLRLGITYDITPPAIEFISPANGSFTNASTAEIHARVIGASDARLNGIRIKPSPDGEIRQSVLLVPGLNQMTVQARDPAGNENASSIVVFLDTENYLLITEPGADQIQNRSTVTVRGLTEPGADVTVNGIVARNRDGNFTMDMTLAEGPGLIVVVSVDRAKNHECAVVRVTIDTKAPDFEVLEPLETTSRTPDVRFRIRGEKDLGLTVNGQPAVFDGTEIYTYTAILASGENTITIRAIDRAGNMKSKELILVYTPPQPPRPHPNAGNQFVWQFLAVLVILLFVTVFIILWRKNKKWKA